MDKDFATMIREWESTLSGSQGVEHCAEIAGIFVARIDCGITKHPSGVTRRGLSRHNNMSLSSAATMK